MCLYFAIPVTIDTLRALIGPMPVILCKASLVVKNIVTYNVSQISLAITVTKFAFLCIYKSIPVMEDNFLSTVAIVVINTISILATAGRFYLPGRPVLNEVLRCPL